MTINKKKTKIQTETKKFKEDIKGGIPGKE